MQFDSLEVRRNSLISRLQVAKLSEFLGHNPWVYEVNSAYKESTAPCVTVVITLFNYSEYIHECLNSICKSKVSGLPQGFDILVVDDCSTDNSQNLVKQYLAESDIPICLISKAFNTGTSDARNIGLKLARAPYVFMMDADNWIYPNCLTTLYNAIKDSNYAATYGIINKFENVTKQGLGFLSCYEWDVRELVRAPYIDAMAMFNKEVVIKLGGYSTELIEYGWYGWEDYDLWLKLAMSNYNCKLVAKIVASYRHHATSQIHTTSKYTANMAKYFHKKFSFLIKKYDDLDKVFGFLVNAELEETQINLETTHTELEKLNAQVNLAKSEIYSLKTIIVAMESSKFWQMRKLWFKFKKMIGYGQNE
ncbi:MAG: glycosyltransferase family 2 protein [Nostoc sp.]|uniref:glycosyltransferase family 2 protein n=1 Tax=Nostoc sp. TaxID=1180 RepID=UPI002FF7369F